MLTFDVPHLSFLRNQHAGDGSRLRAETLVRMRHSFVGSQLLGVSRRLAHKTPNFY